MICLGENKMCTTIRANVHVNESKKGNHYTGHKTKTITLGGNGGPIGTIGGQWKFLNGRSRFLPTPLYSTKTEKTPHPSSRPVIPISYLSAIKER
ncbi:Hypothetical protein CINCED_3A001439 [Cinara cedri]|uniref:Uncharacterized protein n=1 Tax=Cinara cedri TaxID=506608 RepID=A0A5E4MSM6_9HEMI|nr:Hypothetical protein CINCED_3A001439 [Cinara cedri]